tara:strand:- start:159 stop:1295 length:1137 start_codon:yes stop_codon:yes gene_type:complete
MSKLNVDTIEPEGATTTLTLGASGDTVALGTGAGVNFRSSRNMVINGAMQISQRGTSTTTAGFIVDRIESGVSAVDELVCTYSQDSSGADGFANSYKINVDTAESAIAVDEYQRVTYKIEAQDCQNLKYGNASAESVTLSFHVKSNVTGTYAFCIFGDDGSRLIGGTYTISSSATWEKKTLTFAGDTAGTMNDDNGSGLRLCFWLIAGTNFTSGSTNTSWMASTTASTAYGHAVNLGSAINNYWQVTGIQLEIGSVATPFEHKTFGQELAACQRYYFLGGAGNYGMFNAATTIEISVPYPVKMRTTPSFSLAKTSFTISNKTAGTTAAQTSVTVVNHSGDATGSFYSQIGNAGTSLSASAGDVAQFRVGEFLAFDAEL